MGDFECRRCDRSFGSKDARKKHLVDKHGDELLFQPGTLKKAGVWAFVLVLAGMSVWGLLSFSSNYEGGSSVADGPVHWHSTLKIFTCDKYRDLSHLGDTQSHVGNSLLHTHGDNVIHVEGEVPNSNFITLGNYFDSIGKEFSNSSVLDYENGDNCPDGEPGEVRVYVDGEEIEDFTDYVVRDEDEIEVRFE